VFGNDLIKYLRNIDTNFGANAWRGVLCLAGESNKDMYEVKIASHLGNVGWRRRPMMPSSDRLDSKTLRPAATILAHEQDRQGYSRRWRRKGGSSNR
jgi:hypothetical protein